MDLRINGINVHFEIIGTGKPILLLHGVGLDHTIWKSMAEMYASQAQFILPDLRGQGRSELGDTNHTLEQMAEDIRKLLDHLQVESVTLGGHSMGGYVALAFAEKYPDRLAALAMITSNADADSVEKREQRQKDAVAILSVGSALLAEGLSKKLSDDPEIQKISYELIARTEPAGLANTQLAIAARPDRKDVLARLNSPILLVAGNKDRIVPLEAFDRMKKANSKATAVVLPGVGHMPMLETPRTLGALLVGLSGQR